MPIKLIFSIILFLFTYHLIGQAEHYIKGQILDSKTNAPLLAATVSVPSTSIGTIADRKGKFSLKVDEVKHKVIIVSYVGYESVELPISTFNRNTIVIKLQQTTHAIDEVVILARPKIIPLTERKESIKDFVIEKRHIIMLTKKRGKKGLWMTLTDYNGNVTFSESLEKFRLVEGLQTSCHGTNFLLTEYYAYQLYIENNIIYVADKATRTDYDTYIASCLDVNDEYIYKDRKKNAQSDCDNIRLPQIYFRNC